jgi:hypothetical protein
MVIFYGLQKETKLYIVTINILKYGTEVSWTVRSQLKSTQISKHSQSDRTADLQSIPMLTRDRTKNIRICIEILKWTETKTQAERIDRW